MGSRWVPNEPWGRLQWVFEQDELPWRVPVFAGVAFSCSSSIPNLHNPSKLGLRRWSRKSKNHELSILTFLNEKHSHFNRPFFLLQTNKALGYAYECKALRLMRIAYESPPNHRNSSLKSKLIAPISLSELSKRRNFHFGGGGVRI